MVTRVITNAGIQELTKLHGYGLNGKAFRYIALGTNATEPLNTDTNLHNEVTTSSYARKSATVTVDPTLTGDSGSTTVMYSATWEPGEICPSGVTNVDVREIGLFNESNVMYYREVRGTLSFNDTVGATIRIKCRFSRVV